MRPHSKPGHRGQPNIHNKVAVYGRPDYNYAYRRSDKRVAVENLDPSTYSCSQMNADELRDFIKVQGRLTVGERLTREMTVIARLSGREHFQKIKFVMWRKQLYFSDKPGYEFKYDDSVEIVTFNKEKR